MVNATARRVMRLYLVFAIALAFFAVQLHAQTPPQYNPAGPTFTNGSAYGGGAAIAPVAWPAESQWVAYSWGTTFPDPAGDHAIKDLRSSADPSNGGTTPQNYVSVSSGCPDSTLPSIYYFYNATTKTIFFRWRVNQIANNYATGPSPGAYSSTSPWNSALWTVFFSITGTGYRDFAAHLDGSSGAPAQPVDVLRSIWSGLQSNSIDYIGDSANIHSLFTNPTAFVNTNTSQIESFNGNGIASTVQWPNGASETIWDYGTTRSINISTNSCIEYFVDYEIPLSMLNAAAFGGPQMTENTPFQFLFATANSLNNPFQKDIVWEGSFVCDATSPGPFGDALTLSGGIIPQPISTSITAGSLSGCVIPIRAQIMDALKVNACQSISQIVNAQFMYWYDANGNGLADESAGTWVPINNPATPLATIVTTNWDLSNLVQGQYLLALQISDGSLLTGGRGHTTQTWMTTGGDLTDPFATDATGGYYTNVPYQGLSAQSLGINYVKVTVPGPSQGCGVAPPTVTKTHNVSTVAALGSVTYTLTVSNTSGTTIPVTSITDTLPSGFTYSSTIGGSLGSPTGPPTISGSDVTWTFSGVSIPPCLSNPCTTPITRDFSFIVTAGSSPGTFFNTAVVATGVGNLSAIDNTGVTVTTATIAATKSAALASSPSTPLGTYNQNDVVRFTITYTNTGNADVNNVVITDPLPAGFTYQASSPLANTHPAVDANGTVIWNIGTVTVGSSASVTVDAKATQAGSATNGTIANPVTVTSSNAPEVDPSVTVFVLGPVLKISKVGSTTLISSSPATVTYTLEYANIGTANANITTLTDTVPAGFTLTAPIPAGCSQAGGAGGLVTCTINNTLAAGSTVAVTLVFSITNTPPATLQNTATINASNAVSQSANFTVTAYSNTCVSTPYYFHPTTTLVSASSSNLSVGYINVTNGGTGYATPPTVLFSGGGGSGTTATAHGTGGVILGIDVNTPGTGYTSAPGISFSGGGGTGAAATAVMTDVQKIADVTSGNSPTQTATTTVGVLQEFIRFYSDPPDATTAYLLNSTGTNTTVKLGWDRVSGNKIQDTVTLNDFNPATNSVTQISTVSNTGLQGSGNNPQLNLTETLTYPAFSYVLPAGHRLLWIVYAADSNANSTSQFRFNYNGSATYTGAGGTGAAGCYQSGGTVCLIPVRISMTKRADKLAVNPGIDSISYTLTVNNPSTVAVTGVSVADTLPTGVSYTSSTPSVGSVGVSGQNITWTVGSVAAGATQTLVINGTVTTSVTGATITNNAVLTNDYTPAVNAFVTTDVVRPNVVIAKTASTTSVAAGGTFSYTVNALNAGPGTATSVVVTDTLPSGVTSTNYTGSTNTVAIINVTSGGSGYVSAPTVNIVGGGGTGATATAIVSGGAVVAVVVTDGGTGYTSTPSITFSSGAATATAQLASVSVSGQILTFNVGTMSPGATASFKISVQVGTTGWTAGNNTVTNTASVVDSYNTTPRNASVDVNVVATPVLRLLETASPLPAPLTAITVTSGGSGYSSTPSVVISGCAVTPTAVATMSGGVVTGVTITNSGAGCSSPTISFSGGSPSVAATATGTTGQTTGGLLNVALTNGGSGYGSTPSVTIGGCTVAPTATATLSGGVVTGITITGTGSGCPANPTVSFSGGSPTTAATATAYGGERVVFVNVTNGGSYATPPTVSITGSNCSGVVATVSTNPVSSLSGPYSVTGVTLTNNGSGCTGIPNVVFGGSGGAVANAIIGAAPGDTVSYTITATNVGSAPATGVVISDVIPSNTGYQSGGTFSLGTVSSSTIASLAVNASSTFTYLVQLNNSLPFGQTILTTNAGATSTNTASPTNVTTNVNTGATPNYTIDMSPSGDAVGDPLTTLASTAASSNAIVVNSTSLMSIGSYVAIFSGSAWQIAKITGISGQTVTLDIPVSATAGTNIIPVENYTITYSNAGHATGTSVVLTDYLPAGLLYAGVPATNSIPVASSPGIGNNGNVTWNIGTLSNSGTFSLDILVFPSAAGTYTNVAAISDGTALNNRNASTTAQTTFGALNPSKTTSTAQVVAGNIATYTITITNPLAATTASDVQITDNLSSGFTYRSGTTVINNVAAADPCTSGCVGYVTVTNGGSGYTSAPSVSFSGGSATASAVVSGGAVTGVVITNAGSGYVSAPTVSFSGGGGSGAAASASLGSTSSPTWFGQSILGNGTLTLTFQADVSVSTPTGDYENQILGASTNVPELIFDYLGTTQENVHVCAPAPTIHAPAALCANSTNNVASAPRDPAATFTWGVTNGTITTANTGTVDHITIGSGGSGYTTATVTIGAPTGTPAIQATATATVGGGQVTAITMTNFGSGYIATPTVNITGDGVGAAAAATRGDGVVFTAGTAGTNAVISLTKTEGSCTVSSTPVSVPVNTSPSVTTDITSKNVCAGATYSLTPTIANGTTFQWQVSTNGGSTFSNLSDTGGCPGPINCVSGATTSSLSISNVTVAVDGNVYRLVSTNGSCSTNTSNSTLHVTCALDLEVTTNSDSPDPVSAGNNLTYSQTISNLSSTATTGTVTFSQNVPANTTFVSMTPPSGWSCTTPAVGGTGAITCTTSGGVFINANTTTTPFTLIVAVDPNTTDGATITDTATVAVGGTDTDSVAANNTKSTTTTALKRIDIAVTKNSTAFNIDYGPGFVYPGNPATAQALNWYVTMTNNGPSRATGVTLVDTVPTGFTYTKNMAASVTSIGSGYTSVPTVNVSGGVGGSSATAKAKLGGFITVINVTNGGSGYTTEPTVTISGGSPTTNATATARINDTGQVVAITITDEGAGYTSTPTVSFSGGGGSLAAATATVLGTPGSVAQVYFDNLGTGTYTSPPSLSFSGGGGGGGAVVTPSICVYNSGNGVITCTVGTLDKNATTTLTMAGTVGPTAGTVTNTASPTYNETDSNTANDTGSADVRILAPTLVKMLSIDATQTKNAVTITWQTSFEQDNLGFYVWREGAGGQKTRVSKSIITGSAFFTGKKISPNARRSYRFVDAPPPAGQFVQYWIEDVDLKGVHTQHGPVTPKISNATTAAPSTDPEPVSGGIFVTQPGLGVTVPAPTAPAAQRLAQQWNVAAAPAAKLIVTQPGWYKVKKSDLLAAGFDPGTASRAVSVFADGIEVPIAIPEGNFGSSDAIEFYGTGIDTPGAGGHVYYVTKGIGNALRVGSVNGKPGSGAPAPASTPYTFSRIERTNWFPALTNNGDRDNWFGALIVNWFGVPVTNAITVSNLDPNSGTAALEVVIQGSTDDFDHAVGLNLNGHDLGVVRFRSQARSVSNYTIPVSWLTEGENTLSFSADGGDDDITLVESVKLTYAHRFVADSNALAFAVPAATAVTVAGFTTDQVRVVDLTDPQAPQFLPATVTAAADGTKSVSFATSGTGARTVLAFGADRVQAPAQIVVNAASKLNAATNSADLVIITNNAFASAAASLKAARDAQGISTLVADVQNVYDEFSYGAHGPEAIRAFLQRAKTTWTKAPRYAILVGDSSIDPRNYLGMGNYDYVPTKLVPTAYLKTSSDDWFADFNDTGLAQIAIGRLPARSADEAAGIVNKLVRRASVTGPWLKNVEIITDRTNGVPFTASGDQLAALVPAPFTTDRISFAATPNPAQAVVNSFNNGALVMDYIGHGSVEIWSNDVFDSVVAASLANGDKLPFVVTMNCLNGYFHDLWSESLAEAMVKNAGGGAIGVWASSALTSPDQQLKVNRAFYNQLFGGTPTVGDAILKAKQETTDIDVRRTWILFGDPTLKLQP